ncbi:hypothetical protein MMC30_003804 [Trapelia coarctata]|nr:hypothetical protein [Trapelia coarctata]
MSFLATTAVFLRLQARRKQKLPLMWDDYLIIVALIFTIITGVLMVIGAAAGSLGGHTAIGPEGPISDHRLVVFQQTLFANQLTQLLAVGPTKFSVLMFYRRIFRGRLFSIASWSLIAAVIAWTIAFFFGNLLECIPISINWTGSGSDDTCVNEVPMYLAQAYADVATDVLILVLPMPMIWKLQMPMRRKVAISGIFFLGALTVAASVAKMIVQYFVGSNLEQNPDLSYYLTPIVYWPMIEASLGITAACLPTLRPLVSGISLASILDSIRSRTSLLSSARRGSRDRSGYVENESTDANSTNSAIGFKQRAFYTSAPNPKGEHKAHVESIHLTEFEADNGVGEGVIRVQKDFRRDETC